MKKYIIYSLALALSVCMTGCNEDFAEPPITIPEGGIGTGTWNNPMTAYQVVIGSVNDTIPTPWVKGYIVGYCNVNISNTMSAATAMLSDSVPCTVNTNILIAVDSLETDWTKCATVQLPSGAARNALNLRDNPDNWRKLVTVKGETGSKYCGAYGVRSVSDYNWGGLGIQEEPEGPLEALPYLWENFDGSDKIASYTAQGWKNVSVSGGLDGWYIRTFDGQNYITVSAYLGSENGGPYENWLIAPPVDLSKSNSKTLAFRTQAAYPAENSILEVYVLTSDDLSTAQRTKLNAAIAEAPTSGSTYSQWVQSGVLDLSAFDGVVYIGWRYYSAAGGNGGSTTYCVDNVNIGGAPENTPDTPTEGVVYKGLGASDTEITGWTFDENIKIGSKNLWNWTEYSGNHYLNVTAFNSGLASVLSYAISPVIDLTGKTTVTATFDHAAKYQTTLRTLCGFAVREEGGSEWKEFTIPTWPQADSWKFVNSGKIDISSFAGKKIQVAFKYGANSEGADQWEIQNLEVQAK